jgi:hypothetical protein
MSKGVCGMGGVSICTYTEDNPYSEEELAFELDCFFALKHSQGL